MTKRPPCLETKEWPQQRTQESDDPDWLPDYATVQLAPRVGGFQVPLVRICAPTNKTPDNDVTRTFVFHELPRRAPESNVFAFELRTAPDRRGRGHDDVSDVTAIPDCFIPQISEVIEDCGEIAANLYGDTDADHATLRFNR